MLALLVYLYVGKRFASSVHSRMAGTGEACLYIALFFIVFTEGVICCLYTHYTLQRAGRRIENLTIENPQ